jgi:hypothetical protein
MHIQVIVDGATFFDQDVTHAEGNVTRDSLTVSARFEPKQQPDIDAPTKTLIDAALLKQAVADGVFVAPTLQLGYLDQ